MSINRTPAPHPLREKKIIREAVRGDANLGEYAHEALTGAASGAAGGAAVGLMGGPAAPVTMGAGAAAGALGGAAFNMATKGITDLAYHMKSKEDRVSWQAGDLEEKLTSLAGFVSQSPDPELKQLAQWVVYFGGQYKQFVDGYIQKKQIDLKDNVFKQEMDSSQHPAAGLSSPADSPQIPAQPVPPPVQAFKWNKLTRVAADATDVAQVPAVPIDVWVTNVAQSRIEARLKQQVARAFTAGREELLRSMGHDELSQLAYGDVDQYNKLLLDATKRHMPKGIQAAVNDAIKKGLVPTVPVKNAPAASPVVPTQPPSPAVPAVEPPVASPTGYNPPLTAPEANVAPSSVTVHSATSPVIPEPAMPGVARRLFDPRSMFSKFTLENGIKSAKSLGVGLVPGLVGGMAAEYALDKGELAFQNLIRGSWGMVKSYMDDVAAIITEINQMLNNETYVRAAGDKVWTLLDAIRKQLEQTVTAPPVAPK